jgi:hypothetical protein
VGLGEGSGSDSPVRGNLLSKKTCPKVQRKNADVWVMPATDLDTRSGVSRNFVGRGVRQIQLRTEGRENRDLGAEAPWSGVPLNFQMSQTVF